MRRIAALALLLAFAAGGAFLIVQKRARLAAAPAEASRPVPVQTAMASLGSLTSSRTYLGRVEAWQTARIAAQISARVREIAVREGDTAKSGRVVVRLDDADLRHALAAVDAELRQAADLAASQEATWSSLRGTEAYWRREAERDRRLAAEGAVARAAADAAADRWNEAAGRLEAAEKALSAARHQWDALRERRREVEARAQYALLSSPFTGVVSRRWADPGDLAVPGKPLLEIEDRSRLRVLFAVPQEEAARLAPGVEVIVRRDRGELGLLVSRVHPTLNPDRTLTAEAEAPGDAGLEPGAYHAVEVVWERREGLVLIPAAAVLVGPSGEAAAFAVVEGRTELRPVRVVASGGGKVAVEGIDPGLEVVTSTYLGWNRLAAGERVEVTR
ncbi:MAG: efflux RND transporter periplasmic adaptor subunit [Deferrisomatales bacterium]|nr:efflux RND transporter periplasmic adaptor subunit [Deferrisomatales bacterium]